MRPRLSHGDNAKDDLTAPSLTAAEDEIFDVERQDSMGEETGEVIDVGRGERADDVRPRDGGGRPTRMPHGSLSSEGRVFDGSPSSSLTTDGNGRAGYHMENDGRHQVSQAKVSEIAVQRTCGQAEGER